MTTTHTHVTSEFANPYLVCDTCGKEVEGFIEEGKQPIGCTHQGQLVPCGHLGVTSVCPSWGPVDGCTCLRVFGKVEHRSRRRLIMSDLLPHAKGFEGFQTQTDLPTGDQRVNPFEGMSPQEINFITHPIWRAIEEKFKADPETGIVIEQHGKPLAVIIDYNTIERLRTEHERLSRRSRRRGR